MIAYVAERIEALLFSGSPAVPGEQAAPKTELGGSFPSDDADLESEEGCESPFAQKMRDAPSRGFSLFPA